MSRLRTGSADGFTAERTWYGDAWRVDDDGYLHTGAGSPHIDTVTVTLENE